jgi:beta-N-acetylhexosaminidase
MTSRRLDGGSRSGGAAFAGAGSGNRELERLAAACIVPSFPGLEPPDWILRGIEGGLGGICLFSYNVRDREQLAGLNARLREARDDLLIGIDEEGGDVTRLETDRGSSYPGNAALGFVDDESLTEAVAASIGADLAAVGVNLDFAPVADVNANPDNPVIGIRSFGAEPGLVARHVVAFVRGLQSRGVAACAKHFPGHGDTAQDSHLELPTSNADVELGLEPFRAAIAAGVRSIMTAHLRVPALDDAPATLSRRIVTGLLRDELGYDGLVIADALEMKAVSETVGVARSAVVGIAAGVDTLLVGHDLGVEAVDAIRRALAEAVASGELSEQRLREAAGRVATVAAAAPELVTTRHLPDPAARLAARRALVVDGDVALGAGKALVVELRPRPNIAAGAAEHSFGQVLGERFPRTKSVVVHEGDERGDAVAAGQVVLVVRDAHRHPWMRAAAERYGADAVVVELGLPLWRPERARGYAVTHGGSRVSFEALAERMLARSEVRA